MGCVYRARMEGPAGASKRVALKVIHSHLAEDRDFVLMFLDEMSVAMALSHRNIVETFDAGQVEERYFMVMELISGCSLRGLLNRYLGLRPFPLDTALFVGREVAAALDYAHRYKGREGGVIHRDVSPSNILLSSEGDVKLADFGVAKAAGRLYVSSANLIRGKMQYMAPEQAESKADARSDLFSLGAVLYELLTGVPVRSTTGGIDELMLVRRPPRPSSLRDGLPPGLDEMIDACLDREPKNRPASAEEVRRVLAAATFQLQAKDTLSLDPHARLERVLRQHRIGADKGEEPRQPQRLARAVLAEVRAIETDPDLTEAAAAAAAAGSVSVSDDGTDAMPTVSYSESGDTLQDTEHSLDLQDTILEPSANLPVAVLHERATFSESLRPPRRRLAPVLAATVVLLAIAGVLFWLAAGPSPPRRAVPATEATPDGPLRAADLRARADLAPPPDMMPPDQTAPDMPAPDLRPTDLATAVRRPPPRPRPRKRFGYLDVNSIPWARVYIDGRLRGETPLEQIKLRAGVHRVRLVSRARNLTRRYTVRVIAGERLRRVYNLRQK